MARYDISANCRVLLIETAAEKGNSEEGERKGGEKGRKDERGDRQVKGAG